MIINTSDDIKVSDSWRNVDIPKNTLLAFDEFGEIVPARGTYKIFSEDGRTFIIWK